MKYEIIQQADREAAHLVLAALCADINSITVGDRPPVVSRLTIAFHHRFAGARATGTAEVKIQLFRAAGKN